MCDWSSDVCSSDLNPTTGTWTQQDPINTPLDPYNANRYEYAADNPVNYFDPTEIGRTPCVTGVQTCALPISTPPPAPGPNKPRSILPWTPTTPTDTNTQPTTPSTTSTPLRSDERHV